MGHPVAMAIEHWRLRHGNDCKLGWQRSENSKRLFRYLPCVVTSRRHGSGTPVKHSRIWIPKEKPIRSLMKLLVSGDVELGDAVRFFLTDPIFGRARYCPPAGATAFSKNESPVRCAKLRLSRLAIGAAIRIQDSVVDGRSHFLARCAFASMIDGDQFPLLFLADEL